MTFRVGQKVVKVPARNIIGHPSSPRLVNGQIYTIREIDTRAVHLHGVATIRVNEIVGPMTAKTTVGPWECGYRPENFRPIVDRKTSIEAFKRLLVPGSKVSEPV